MNLTIDKALDLPLVEQVVAGIRSWIEREGAGGGRRLPSIRRLSADYDISRNVAVEAYERLVAQGLVKSRAGSGFFVAERAPATLAEGSIDPARAEDVTGEMWQLFRSGDDDAVRLGCGWLPAAWHEEDDFTHAIRHVTRQSRMDLFDYSTPMGLPQLRVLIQQRIRLLGIEAHTSQVLMTAGASHALDLLVRMLLNPGDVVFVESPGYYNLFGLLRLQGAVVIGVPRLRGGPEVEEMESLLKTWQPKIFFINSVFQNPTGTTLTPTVAHRVLQLADDYDFQIVEDDIYADFQHEPTIRLASLDGLQRVTYVGSFSKSLSCSLRVGFITATPDLIRRLVDVKMLTSISASRFAERVITTMLQNGAYRKMIERLRLRLSSQMTSALNLTRDAGWEIFAEPAGGMFIWARHPDVSSSAELVANAQRAGVRLSPGDVFLANSDSCPWVRINVAYTSASQAVRFLNNPGG